MSEESLKIQELESEIKYLKYLLDLHNIEYEPRLGVIKPETIDREKALKFARLFLGRKDVYAKRWQSEKGDVIKTGYSPVCRYSGDYRVCPRFGKQKRPAGFSCPQCEYYTPVELGIAAVIRHLQGNAENGSDVIGVYPIKPENQSCNFLCFDFDHHGKESGPDGANEDMIWKEEVDAIRCVCKEVGIPVLVERSRSGRGAHVWIFFTDWIPAAMARRFGFALIEKGAEMVDMRSFQYFDRMIPAQDKIKPEGLGNLIALPLQGKALKELNSVFVDEDWEPYYDQWAQIDYFSDPSHKLSLEQINQYLDTWNVVDVTSLSKAVNDITGFEYDGVKPWERDSCFRSSDVTGPMNIVLSNMIYIEKNALTAYLRNQIYQLASVWNADYFAKKRRGDSANGIPYKFCYAVADRNDEYTGIPRGLLDSLLEKCSKAGIFYNIKDERCTGKHINVTFHGELTASQKNGVEKVLQHETGVLHAVTGWGKTVAGCGIIAALQTNTLILVPSTDLIDQWKKAIQTFLIIRENLPTYKTAKKGTLKTRKELVGLVQGVKNTAGYLIDIALAGSLYKKGEISEDIREYGLVLVDECHHSAGRIFSSVLNELRAKYVYGFTATPARSDGLWKVCEMNLGPIRFSYTEKERNAEQNIRKMLIPRFTRFVYPYGNRQMQYNEIVDSLISNEERNRMIEDDVRECIGKRRACLILTKRVEHAKLLFDQLQDTASQTFLMTGASSKEQMEETVQRISQADPEKTMLIVATGQLVGEGFDCPRLDTLFLVCPMKWKGNVEQYVGRIGRNYPGKNVVTVYDYVDWNIPMFEKMYRERHKTYKRLGYQLKNGGKESADVSNAIYDFETYYPVYLMDIRNAINEIIISSETLSRIKVTEFLSAIASCQSKGVKITVVTWHPDAYSYGRDETRNELLYLLYKAGIRILYCGDCRHFAVIDRKIVWYGSMNLLSKATLDDDIIRLEDVEIASELLAKTFSEGGPMEGFAF